MSSNVVPLSEPTPSQREALALYHEGVPALVRGLCIQGCRTDDELARALGVEPYTFKVWRKRVPDVADAVFQGSRGAVALVLDGVFRRAMGYSVSVKEISWVKGTPHEVVRTEHVPADPKAAIAILGLYGYGPDNPLPLPEGAVTQGQRADDEPSAEARVLAAQVAKLMGVEVKSREFAELLGVEAEHLPIETGDLEP
jgi:hypothetical protein